MRYMHNKQQIEGFSPKHFKALNGYENVYFTFRLGKQLGVTTGPVARPQ